MSKRAIIYTRLSSYAGEKDASTSPQRQREVCEAYAASQGWTVVDVIEDLNVSGSARGLRLHRPGLERARAMFGKYDVMLFTKLDRLARNVLDFNVVHEEFAASGVSLVSVQDRIDMSSAGGRFYAQMMAAFAEMEAVTIAERSQAGQAKAVELGRWRGGRTLFGYKIVPHPSGRGKGLAIDEDEARIIRFCYDRILQDGWTLYRLCQHLNTHAMPPRESPEWHLHNLRNVLVNESLCGYMKRHKAVLRDNDGMPREYWEPIVTGHANRQIRAALSQTGTDSNQRSTVRRTRLLSGIIACGTCGRNLATGYITKDKKTYKCASKSSGLSRCTRCCSILGEPADAYVTDQVLLHAGTMPTFTIESAQDDSGLQDVLASITDVATSMVEPNADIVELSETLIALQRRRAEIEASVKPTIDTYVEGPPLQELWNTADDLSKRRDLLAMMIDRVIVHPANSPRQPAEERLEIVWTHWVSQMTWRNDDVEDEDIETRLFVTDAHGARTEVR